MYEAAGKMSKWWTEMMVTPISDEASVFPDEKIMDCCDETESFEDYGDKRFNYVHGNDFALSQAAQADYNAWFVGKLLGNKIKIANIYYKLGVEERTKDEFVKWYFRYGGKCVMDNSNFGRVWLPEFVKQGIKAEGYDFKSKGQTREELLQTIKDALFSKRLIFPRSFNDTRAKVFIDALIEELRSFREEYNDKNGKIEWVCTGRHDDLVIGLGLMIKAADQGKGRVGFTFADL
jgi:hypothetical protein